MVPLAPEIVAADTWRDILGAMMPLLIVAVGQAFVLIVAGIDLSATSNLAISSVLAAAVMTLDGGPLAGAPAWLAIAAGVVTFVAVGSALGSLNGACVTRFNMPPFIVTLTTMMFFSGLAIWITTLLTPDGSSIGNLPPGFAFLGQGRIGGIPFSVLIALVVCVAAHVALSRTLYSAAGCSRSASTRAPPRSRACRSAASCSGPTSSAAPAPASPPSSTPRGSRPARRCWASASCSTSWVPR